MVSYTRALTHTRHYIYEPSPASAATSYNRQYNLSYTGTGYGTMLTEDDVILTPDGEPVPTIYMPSLGTQSGAVSPLVETASGEHTVTTRRGPGTPSTSVAASDSILQPGYVARMFVILERDPATGRCVLMPHIVSSATWWSGVWDTQSQQLAFRWQEVPGKPYAGAPDTAPLPADDLDRWGIVPVESYLFRPVGVTPLSCRLEYTYSYSASGTYSSSNPEFPSSDYTVTLDDQVEDQYIIEWRIIPADQSVSSSLSASQSQL